MNEKMLKSEGSKRS